MQLKKIFFSLELEECNGCFSTNFKSLAVEARGIHKIILIFNPVKEVKYEETFIFNIGNTCKQHICLKGEGISFKVSQSTCKIRIRILLLKIHCFGKQNNFCRFTARLMLRINNVASWCIYALDSLVCFCSWKLMELIANWLTSVWFEPSQ